LKEINDEPFLYETDETVEVVVLLLEDGVGNMTDGEFRDDGNTATGIGNKRF
jgi:hypothetical protein